MTYRECDCENTRKEIDSGTFPNAATGSAAIPADVMVDCFTDDLWKLAQDGGLTMSDWPQLNGSAVPRNVSDALIAFAMQMYYEDTANATNASKQLFTDLSAANDEPYVRLERRAA